MSKTVGIYKIENLVNGNIYIGQSIDIEKRWVAHQCDLRGNRHCNSHLQSAWNKYGEDSFAHEIIEICDAQSLDEREKYWINFYDATNVQKGYNMSLGGQYSHEMTDEVRAKISQTSKGRVTSEKSKKLISEHRKGIKFTDEQKLNNSLGHKLKYALKHPDTWYKNKTKLPSKGCIGENHPLSKYTDEDIKHVIDLLLDNKPNAEISKETGVNVQVVGNIRTKKSWKHLIEGLDFPPSPHAYTEETNNKIIEDIKNNLTRKEIIAKYNISDKKLNKMKCSLKEVS